MDERTYTIDIGNGTVLENLVLNGWSSLLRGALVCRGGQSGVTAAEQALGAARSARELMNAYNEIQKAMQYAQGNVSVAALCGLLLWQLR